MSAAWEAETGRARPQSLSGPQSEFKTSLDYPGNSRLSWATEGKFVSKEKKKKEGWGNVQQQGICEVPRFRPQCVYLWKEAISVA